MKDTELNLNQQKLSMVMGLLASIEDSDYTTKHSLLVGRLCKGIAEELNLTDTEKKTVIWAGYFHDIGKVKIDKNIMFKLGKLSDDEFEEMRKHCQYGYEILNLYDMKKEAELVLQHHEKLDGTGYPNKLKNDEIHKLTKIISVADVYSAMVIDRPYQKKKTSAHALLELYGLSGNHFDITCVKALHKVLIKTKKIKIY